MNRCLVVATDGSAASRAALQYALDFASALNADEIACLCACEEDSPGDLAAAAAVTAGELTLANGLPGPFLFELPDYQTQQRVQADAVLDACRDSIAAAGLKFSPVIASRQPGRVIARTAHMGDIIFLGRNSDSALPSHRVGSTVSVALQSSYKNVVVCPAPYKPVDRIVLLMAGDLIDAELVARGATWAEALSVPALVAVSESGRRISRSALNAAKHVVAGSGVATNAVLYDSRPEVFARTLQPTDLVLVARRRHWELLHLWFGNATDRIVESVTGPVAVMAKC
jgi:nucleotide-binding universal stress UspA family protein